MTCIETPDQNIGAWHDSITLQTLPRINIGVKYIKNTSEYIPKLQLHQHEDHDVWNQIEDKDDYVHLVFEVTTHKNCLQ